MQEKSKARETDFDKMKVLERHYNFVGNACMTTGRVVKDFVCGGENLMS